MATRDRVAKEGEAEVVAAKLGQDLVDALVVGELFADGDHQVVGARGEIEDVRQGVEHVEPRRGRPRRRRTPARRRR